MFQNIDVENEFTIFIWSWGNSYDQKKKKKKTGLIPNH
jgi:hypothetical protein